tara:strand:+ start:19367 stop:20323 length:957 start_codon:yes stop_codon:yes gene_type:complete
MKIKALLLLVCIVIPGIVLSATKNGFDVSDALIPEEEILFGGPQKDGIPAIYQPAFESIEEAKWLRDRDRVLAVEINGEARAYPIRILDWHEIVNDKIGDQYFAVTYCPLCGTGMVFATNAGEGALLFGVSGLLYNSDVLLYDSYSESLWSQILGKAVSGPLKGKVLSGLAVTHTTWGKWAKKHPETKVLSRETGLDRYSRGGPRDYLQGPYDGYENSRRLRFKVSHSAPNTYHPKKRVIGIEVDGVFKAYPFKELSKQGKAEFTDQIAGSTFLIEWDEEAQSSSIRDETGKLLPAITGFWFAWYTFHPETEIFTAPR